MKEIYVRQICSLMGLRDWQVVNCAELFAEGNTIPFISRYRKEKTGGMDDAQIAGIKHWIDVYDEMEKRKSTVLTTISELGKLSDELRLRIENTVSSVELEDLYLPYKPKRRTRATVARELGLEPLADAMWNVRTRDPHAEALRFVKDKVSDIEMALGGARDIIAERFSETAAVRDNLRAVFRQRRICASMARTAKDNPEADKYRSYFNFSMPLSRIPSHNVLALLRAQNEGILNLEIDADPDRAAVRIFSDFCKSHGNPSALLAEQIKLAASDAYKRLLEPSISNEIIREAKEKADNESIRVFGENLRQLLLSAPVGQKRTMAIDPGFRNGCKIACLDEHGDLLHHEIIFPHPPQNEKVKSISALVAMLEKYRIEAIAVGNGTASRETVDFLAKVQLPEACKVWTVSEDGASVYSASEVARKEFPDEDVTVRGAVSIGRRLMDPLAELVKIDPKAMGIGQYQHDVDQTLLREKLDNTVEYCVNAVGVNLNTASSYLLSYVSGIGPGLAGNIVAYRQQNGGFKSRIELLKVPRLGDKAYQQCAGFLRIQGASNPLDNSSVHPESYGIVERMAMSVGVSISELVGNEKLISGIKAQDFVTQSAGLPTINDILKELLKPGLDPREQASEFSFADDIRDITDLRPGMELPGIVTNITNFGAFVDIGLHENGLIHVSQMGVRGLADPGRVLHLHQQIKAEVLDIDLDRKRIALRLVKS